MPPSRTSFVTGCQQLLALGVVLAALAPAASVVSLDVVRETPGGAATTTIQGDLAAYTRAARQPSKVPTEVVDPTVREFALTAASGSSQSSERLAVIGGTTTNARGKVGALPADDALTSLAAGGRRVRRGRRHLGARRSTSPSDEHRGAGPHPHR